MRFLLIPAALLAASLVACHNSDQSDITPPLTSASNKLRHLDASDNFASTYRAALTDYVNSTAYWIYTDDVAVEESAADGAGAPVTSDTTVQEAGVDEADRVKVANGYLYSLGLHYGEQHNQLSVYRLDDAAANAQLTSQQTLTDDEVSYRGLYVTGNDLLALGDSQYNSYYWYDSYGWGGTRAGLSRLTLTNPAQPQVADAIEFDGNVLSSRRIGNNLFVVSRYFPQIDGVEYYPQSEAAKEANASRISALPIEDLLPGHYGDGVRQPLVRPEDCLVSATYGSDLFRPDIISVLVFDTQSLSLRDSLCYIGDAETLYASTEALYLATTRYHRVDEGDGMVSYVGPDLQTDIHEITFSAEGGLEYTASGSVSGQLGFSVERRPYRFSARDGYLRVITERGWQALDDGQSPVRLTILQREGDELQPVSTLPAAESDPHLGKPREQLYATWFTDDRAYLVTFRTTDPLYVLDLSNPSAPAIAGELEIPGYSEFLFPVGQDLLLGLGKDAIADTGGSGDFGGGAWYQGVKVALYDVSDPAAPREADAVIIGDRDTDSSALWSPHAFSYLAGDGESRAARFALPVRLHDENHYAGEASYPWHGHEWTATGLYPFEIDENARTLIEREPLWAAQAANGDGWLDSWGHRSVISENALFYDIGEALLSRPW